MKGFTPLMDKSVCGRSYPRVLWSRAQNSQKPAPALTPQKIFAWAGACTLVRRGSCTLVPQPLWT